MYKEVCKSLDVRDLWIYEDLFSYEDSSLQGYEYMNEVVMWNRVLWHHFLLADSSQMLLEQEVSTGSMQQSKTENATSC